MSDFFVTFVIFLLTLGLYLYLNSNRNYWKNKNVPYISPIPFLGNLKQLIFLKKSPGEFLGDLYNCSEGLGQRFFGFFIFNNEPALLVRDPELVKNIFVKDFDHFSSRYVECNENIDPVGVNNLFVLRGPKWKYLRRKLTPAFTTGKLKQMFPLIRESGEELLEFLEGNTENGNKNKSPSVVLEAKHVLARYTIDVISTCAFGIKSNCLKNSAADFSTFAHHIFDMTIKRSLEVRSFFFMHRMAKLFKFYFLQEQSTEFFRRVFWETFKERERNKIVRNDFVDVLISLREEQKTKIENKVEGEEVFQFEGDLLLAQPVLFFTAGFETTATIISLALYELALQPHIQDRLRVEIQNVSNSHGGELTYDGLFEAKYLDMVVSEALRKYPPMPFIDRICTKDYKIPGTDVIIPKGTAIFIPLYKGLHYDPEYYPAPEKFDPERFADENKKKRHPFTYVPFGEGPHSCIGMRFGLMNTKIALSMILSKFRVEICEESDVPLEIDNRSIIITAKNGNHLRFVKL